MEGSKILCSSEETERVALVSSKLPSSSSYETTLYQAPVTMAFAWSCPYSNSLFTTPIRRIHLPYAVSNKFLFFAIKIDLLE